MGKYAIGPIWNQAVRYADTLSNAIDIAQFLADEYLIPYHVWSTKDMDLTSRGDTRTKTSLYPQNKKKRKGHR